MGLREELAKVRLARSKLEITRAKLEKLDEERRRLESRLHSQPDTPPAGQPKRRRRRGLDID